MLDNLEPQVVSDKSQEATSTFVDKSAVSEWRWKSLVNTITWGVILLLAPFTVAAIVSQNSIPGDMLYPLKRSLENMVLAAATVSPATRAAFRTDLAQRRFNEAQKLLITRQDVSGLSEFVSEIKTTQLELKQVSDPKQKEELTQKLIASISEYQTRLNQVQVQVQQETTQPVPVQSGSTESSGSSNQNQSSSTIPPTRVSPSAIPTQSTGSTIQSTPVPTQTSSEKSSQSIPSQTVSPTNVPTQQSSRSTPIQSGPTQTQVIPSNAPVHVPATSTAVVGAIVQTREDLNRIQHELQEQRERNNYLRREPTPIQLVPTQTVGNNHGSGNRENSNRR